ncbi:hypothetical protein FSOLCH5_014600 [Fusarium solani]
MIEFNKYNGLVFLTTPDARKIVPILPIERGFLIGATICTRTQFPLIICYAITIHKSQSITEDMIVTDLSCRDFQTGLSYVAVSRVKTLEGLMLDAPFDRNHLLPLRDSSEKFPVPLTIGPYGNDLHFSDFCRPQADMYANMAKDIKPLGAGACFETPDPIIWSKEHGYAIVRADARGFGGSPGVLDAFGIGRTELIKEDSEAQGNVGPPTTDHPFSTLQHHHTTFSDRDF